MLAKDWISPHTHQRHAVCRSTHLSVTCYRRRWCCWCFNRIWHDVLGEFKWQCVQWEQPKRIDAFNVLTGIRDERTATIVKKPWGEPVASFRSSRRLSLKPYAILSLCLSRLKPGRSGNVTESRFTPQTFAPLPINLPLRAISFHRWS